MHPVLGTMMPEICEAPHFSCQPRLHTQIVGMRSLHSPMTSLKTSIKTITYLSDTGCLEIQGASLMGIYRDRKTAHDHLYHQDGKKSPH
ncbi:hypothetical protein BZL69_30465 [Escherichia coli]|nr:hypothetical protein BZL69_30465 [Escherichia coli]